MIKVLHPINQKIGVVLKRWGEKLSSRGRPLKIMPLFLDSEDVKIERKQIIRSHDIFQNEVRNNYTDVYMNTLYGLLFQNEKKYYVKRNQMTIEENKDSFVPPAVKSSSKSNPIVYNKTNLKEIKNKVRTRKSEQKFSFNTERMKKNLFRDNIICKKIDITAIKKQNKNFDYLSTETNKFVDIVHSSNKMAQTYRNNMRDQVMRRFTHLSAMSSPLKPLDYKAPHSTSDKSNRKYARNLNKKMYLKNKNNHIVNLIGI